MFIRRLIAALTGEPVKPTPGSNITPAPEHAPGADPALPPAAEFEFVAQPGVDRPDNIKTSSPSPQPQMNVQFIPLTPEQADDWRARAQRHAKLTGICTMIHVAHLHQSNLAEADACGVWNELLERVRGNRPAETWQPTDADVQLIYEGFRAWFRRNTRPIH